MRIFILTHAFNSLTQRIWLDLAEAGHTISVVFDVNDAATVRAVNDARPNVILAPFLKRAIPEIIWRTIPCFIVHPGPSGDKGPSALDWAILEGHQTWGVTVIQAVAEMDAGPVWAHRTFAMRDATKSSLYRREVTEAAVAAVTEALDRFNTRQGPHAPDNGPAAARPAMIQQDRRIDWATLSTRDVVRHIRAADGTPGVKDTIGGHDVWLHDAHSANGTGQAGDILGRGDEAVLRATTDGAVWIGQMRVGIPGEDRTLKLPAVEALRLLNLPLPHKVQVAGEPSRVIHDRQDDIAIIQFPFYNGAMSLSRCRALEAAIRDAGQSDASAVLLTGGEDFWSNGIDLAMIEASDSPADASMAVIEAIDDVCLALLDLTDQWVVSLLRGNAGAGGVFMALAADEVLARDGVVLNPHYKNMGNLYGSEYWTYLLPRRLGPKGAQALMETRLPVSARGAKTIGLIDDLIPGSPEDCEGAAIQRIQSTLTDPKYGERLREKRAKRLADEAVRPLASFRAAELSAMRLNFFGFDTSYHVARYNFMTKVPKSRTPHYLSRPYRFPSPVG